MTSRIPENSSTSLVDWSPVIIMVNTMPPRDPALEHLTSEQAKKVRRAEQTARPLVQEPLCNQVLSLGRKGPTGRRKRPRGRGGAASCGGRKATITVPTHLPLLTL